MRVPHPGWPTHALRNQFMERCAGGALRDQCEHDVAAVAVGEAFTGWELARVSVEHPCVWFGGRELVDGDGEDVVGDGRSASSSK